MIKRMLLTSSIFDSGFDHIELLFQSKIEKVEIHGREIYRFGLNLYPFCTGLLPTAMGSHHGHAAGASFCIVPVKFVCLFSKKAFTPSLLSFEVKSSYTILLSNKCVASGLPGPRYINSLIKCRLTPEQFLTISSASSRARGRTASDVGSVSVKRSDSSGCEAGYIEPVVQR